MPEEQNQSQIPDQEQRIPSKTPISKEAREQALSPHKSVWPIALAFALVIMLVGFITHSFIVAIGAVAVVVAIIGWGLERR